MSPLVRLLTTVVVVLSVVVMLEAVVDERQSGDVPGGKITEGRVWIFQSRRGGGEPCTPTSLTVSLTNAEQLIVRFFFANGGFTNLVYDNPGESFSLPASDLPQDVVLIVIFAPPLSSSTSSCINSVDLQGCGQEEPPTTTTPATTTTISPRDCGRSPALDALYEANSIAVGGSLAGSCDVIPWQVSIETMDNRSCQGSIIDANHILTAAICIPENTNITIKAGDYDTTVTESTEQIRIVSSQNATIHPDYDLFSASRLYNIAVVRLSEPLDLTQPCVTPVCLDPDFVISGQDCTVSGWYRTFVGIEANLRIGNVLTVNGADCEETFSVSFTSYLEDPSIQLCAGYLVDAESCQGIFGGPLVCRDNSTNTYTQVGIGSSNMGCSSANKPVRYTDVRALYDWVLEQIAV